jgi:hypothetical protein
LLHHSAPLALAPVCACLFVYLKQVLATGHFVLDIVAVALVTLAVMSASLLLFFLLLLLLPITIKGAVTQTFQSQLDHGSTLLNPCGLAGPT